MRDAKTHLPVCARRILWKRKSIEFRGNLLKVTYFKHQVTQHQ